MAAALPLQVPISADEIIAGLAEAEYRPDALLRQVCGRPAEIAPAVIDVLDQAADGVYLLPKQTNLLFWGIHALAAARMTLLYRPLLRFLRQCPRDDLDQILGGATTETIGRIVISVCDGDAAPLVEASVDANVDGYVRWNLIAALARLAFDGVVARDVVVEFLDRFERERLAEPDDVAWEGWQDAVSLLGLETMRERLHAAWDSGRIEQDEGDREYIENQLTLAQTLAPADPSLFERAGVLPIEDPVAALGWVRSEDEAKKIARRRMDSADPAAAIALADRELTWLDGFLARNLEWPTSLETVEQIDGMFCALLAGPQGASLDECIPAIWSREGLEDDGTRPDCDSEEQAAYLGSLLDRHWRTIATRLDRGYPHPTIAGWHADEARGRYWAGGFVRGVAMRAEAWGERSAEEDIGSFLAAMVSLGADPDEFPDDALAPDERRGLLDVLPKALVHLHCLWRGRSSPYQLGRRSESVGGSRPARKIGRNEPCPCGSGKKYKRCCGSSAREPIEL